LQIAQWGCAVRDPEYRVVQAAVVADQKVPMVKEIESFSPELQMKPFGKPEILDY
jgi:hypothetical protein